MKYLIIILLLLIVYYINPTEQFANKQEKTNVIYNWFKTTVSPSYIQYKTDLNGASNIVEYEDVLKLHKMRNLTKENVALII